MRILHVSASYLPALRYGGTIVSVHGLCRALAARGHDVHVFTTSVNGDDDSDVPHEAPVNIDGVTVTYFRSPRARRFYWAPRMRAALRTSVATFDLVHTHAIFLWPMWAAQRAARRAGVPYVVSPRGMLEKDLVQNKSTFAKGVLIGFFEKPALERAAAIHVTSRREADEAASFGFNLPPFIDIPNGVDFDTDTGGTLSPAVSAAVAARPFILFLGRISWKKGLDRLIAALPHAPATRLVIAGNDDEVLQPSLRAQATSLGVGSRVTFVGSVGGPDKSALFAAATALVLTSYSENFGNVVVEAMAAGCPVIVTPEVGIAPYVEAAGAGWVVQADPALLGSRIEQLAADAVLRRDMGERGKATAHADFSWPRIAERMEAAYLTLV